MTTYYRVMLGKQSAYAVECVTGGFLGADFDMYQDLSGRLSEDWREFNREFIPVFQANVPGKTRVAAGLACGMLWTVAKGMLDGDVILAPDGHGSYHVGRINGDYSYVPDGPLPHRRQVHWMPDKVSRASMSDELKRATGTPGTVVNINRFASEVEALVDGPVAPDLVAADPTVEDASVFALEKHLEDFLVANWSQTVLGQTHRIYEVDGEVVGQQYPTDTGPLDILAVSHDQRELLVVELKRGRASDTVVGQVQRYMGYVLQDLAEPGQTVRGAIIALEDDVRIRRALAVAPNIDFYRYEVTFKLHRN